MASRRENFDLEVYPLTPERWADLEELFGENGRVEAAGVCGGDSSALNSSGRKVRETGRV